MSVYNSAGVGCSTCRKRKCDRKSPVCDHCARGGRTCVYPHIFDVVHRDRNQATESQARAKWRSRVQPRIETTTAAAVGSRKSVSGVEPAQSSNASRSRQLHVLVQQPGQAEPSAELALDARRTIPTFDLHASPSQDLYEAAFNRFNYDFLDYSKDAYTRRDTFDLIPPLCRSLPRNSLLSMTLRAVFLANLAARTHSPHVLAISQKHYVQSLSMLRAVLQTPGAIQKAETVFASYLLWLYEVMTKYESYGSAMAHHVGSESIMQSVAEHGWDSLTRFSRTGLGAMSVNYGLLRHIAYFQRPSPWLKQLVENSRTGDKRATLVQLCYECTRVCADLRECEYFIRSKGSSSLPERLDQASVTDAKTLDGRFHAWELQRDMEHPRLNVDIRPKERKVAWVRDLFCAAGAPRQMCISMPAEAFLEWKIYWIFRLILNYCIVDLDDALESSGSDANTASAAVVRVRSILTPVDIDAAEEVITTLTHAISAAIPSVLGV
ncbi:hypothetical protein M409DRAFT_50268 [Zasmidium cellare ATCC 36951]|uniref:Zn(2)-C6 fungal-type domain-containing protein n=1 Tax=Zasmidium cellare ATCC 36951 TaxID=1080233 RepID=A0A6A6CXZ1_ZASCE|nr:uncharacterized protein M409DRAFT_50268 [Zasmidium cellare ATCC 36951]KAF2171593.1 hypothetical protein M409DRAFT_50268 [Zasmidium cellare ATCC 36951]